MQKHKKISPQKFGTVYNFKGVLKLFSTAVNSPIHEVPQAAIDLVVFVKLDWICFLSLLV